MRTAETSQAAEITAAMLRTIPGAFRGPKIAAIATNATAATMKRDDCIFSGGSVQRETIQAVLGMAVIRW